MLPSPLRSFVLDFVREVARRALESGMAEDAPLVPLKPLTRQEAVAAGIDNVIFHGLFVTYKNRRGTLRGCTGTFRTGMGGLAFLEALQRVAIGTLHDSRFQDSPVTLAELVTDIRVTVSVLSDLSQALRDPLREIVLGVHGIVCMDHGGRVATFLPEVAPEHRWSVATFMTECAAKAGIPRKPGVAVPDDDSIAWFTFTTDVMEEQCSAFQTVHFQPK